MHDNDDTEFLSIFPAGHPPVQCWHCVQWRRNRGSGGSMNQGPRAPGTPSSGATEKF